MEALCSENPKLENSFVPIEWNEECVVPPYEDFYEDGLRWVPSFREQLPTGLEHVTPLLPVTREEYHNRLVKEWVHRNEQRRLQAQHMSDMLGLDHQSPVLPAVPKQKGTDFATRETRWLSARAHHEEAPRREGQGDSATCRRS
eukprot:2084047-Amphidinium_carterae.2